MLYLSPLLLSIAVILLLLTSVCSLKLHDITLNKASIISISISLTLTALVSMIIGQIFSTYLLKGYSSSFGGTLISLIGIYYLIEHKKKVEYNNGYDTSFYYDVFPRLRKYLLTPIVLDKNNSKIIELNESLPLSLSLSCINMIIFFAAGFLYINLPITLLFIFLFTSLLVQLITSIKSPSLHYLLSKYCCLLNGCLFILIGALQIII